MGVDPWSTCSQEKKGCVKWVEKYFKDCVCNVSSKTSFGLGLVSLFCWAFAEIPQIITNFQTKSGHGVSLGLLLTWVVGDIFNLEGCLLEPVTLPTQFYTALLYTTTTVVLVLQTIYYDYCIRWWNNRGFEAIEEVDEERKPLNPKKEDPAKPISTNSSNAASPRIDVYYTSARSMANSGGSPYSGTSYLRTARSGPSGYGAALHDSSSEDESVPQLQRYKSSVNTNPRKITSNLGEVFDLDFDVTIASLLVGYGTFVISAAGLPLQVKAIADMHIALYTKNMIREAESNSYGIILGWIMAAIYMGGRFPQIYLNIKRGNVEGLNPLMFIFALIANATYVGSILVRSVEWDRIKANAPWLLDAAVCVLLDLFIIIQFAYYKLLPFFTANIVFRVVTLIKYVCRSSYNSPTTSSGREGWTIMAMNTKIA